MANRFGTAIFLLLGLTFPRVGSAQASPYDILIRGGRVMDGAGNPWTYADVGIRDGRIVAVGRDLGDRADRVIDATGKVVAPGFIDLHSHGGDNPGVTHQDKRYRAAPNLVSQGVTTFVVNQDGRGPWPVRDQRASVEANGVGPNTIMLFGHGSVRREVMGRDYERAATPAEVTAMRGLVRQAMSEGAYGMSAGHEYVPMIWSTTEEVVALVEEIRPWQGIYIVHERSSGAEPMWWWPSEDAPGAPTMLDAVMETIEVAERTGVTSIQTHLKARGSNFWGSGATIIQLINRARERGVNIWADAYPYNTTGSDGNTVLIPPRVRQHAVQHFEADDRVNYAAALRALMSDTTEAMLIRQDIQHEILRRGDADNLLVLEAPNGALVGQRLRDIAAMRGVNAVDMAILLQLEGNAYRPGGVRLRGFSLSEIDLEMFYGQPWVATASDAGITLPEDGFVHPRFYGTFPRKIRRYALERKILSVEDAVRSMTSLPATILGLTHRGYLRAGQWADLVVFDLDDVGDLATPLNPHQYSSGIEFVLVNGEFVVENSELTWALPGRALTPNNRTQLTNDSR